LSRLNVSKFTFTSHDVSDLFFENSESVQFICHKFTGNFWAKNTVDTTFLEQASVSGDLGQPVTVTDRQIKAPLSVH